MPEVELNGLQGDRAIGGIKSAPKKNVVPGGTTFESLLFSGGFVLPQERWKAGTGCRPRHCQAPVPTANRGNPGSTALLFLL